MESSLSAEKSVTFRNVEADAPAPIGHYSHVAELDNGIIYLSGQKAWLPRTGELIDGDVAAQTDLIFDNVAAILKGIGLDLSAITRISCHLAEVDAYAEFNAVYARRLGDHKPARTVLAGYALRGGALVELVAEAYRPSRADRA